MAVLYITEYAQMAQVGGPQQMPQEPPLVAQTMAITGSSTQSVAFNAGTRFVRIHTDVICLIELAANPTATAVSGTAGSGRMAANQTEYRGVPQGAAYKVAVISAT